MTTHPGLPISHLTEFVGRAAELHELCALVSTRQLVTVTGQAGVGKSRTAARLAEMLRRSFGGSIALLQMAGGGAERIGETIAGVVGATGTTTADAARALGDRPFLIIVDDIDDAATAAPVIEDLLEHTTETRILVTSRERTGIRGETPYVLAPLELPSVHALQEPPETALRSATSTLLVQRIRDADPTFQATMATLEDLLVVCRATDGLPRFIEAAARVVCALGAREAAIAVSEDPTVVDCFLPRGCGAVSSCAVLDASITRVSSSAADLMERLSLWESGCDLRFAAELFCGERLAGMATHVAELIDHSLVRSETIGRERRLRVPLHYRAHLLAAWDAEGRRQAERQVREALLRRLRYCASAWFSDDQLASIQFLNRHAADITPLLSAMSSDPADAHEALEIISSLRYYWQLHPVDPWPHVRDWLDTALALDTTRDAVTLRAMQTDAYIAFHEGDLDGARMRLLTIDTEFDSGLAGFIEELFGVFVEALVELAEGDLDSAKPKFVAVLRDSIEAGVRDHLGEKYWHLAACQIASGEQDDALTTLTDGLAYCDRVGDIWGRGYMWCLLAVIADRQGRHADARDRVRKSIEVMSDFGDRVGLALCVQLLASISARNGEEDTVAQLAVLMPRPMLARPPIPLPEIRQGNDIPFGPPTPLPDNQSLGEVLSRIIDGDPPRSQTQRIDASSVLSVRETEVAALIAEGLGNPAIAARLVLSRRTVEGHVQRILAKLGFRSRSQIAVWAAQNADIASAVTS